MEQSFWLERWQSHQLGWHRQDVNPLLCAHWSSLGLEPSAKVFVPLCGKTLDMWHLAEQGHEVLGCELSGIAAKEFFTEAGIVRAHRQAGHFVRHQGGGVTLLEGDLFHLDSALLAGVEGVFDRGALVALPSEMRIRYVAHVMRVLPCSAQTLLISLEYDQSRIGGPPFSVAAEEVHELYDDTYQVELLYSEDTEEIPPRFAEAGLGDQSSPVRQKVWTIRPSVLSHK